jgi:ATP-binding cassette, subfamily B, bacterial
MVIAARTPQSFRERIGTLRHLPPFVRLVWASSPGLTLASLILRLARAVVPVLVLYVGKLIVDAVVAEARLPQLGMQPPESTAINKYATFFPRADRHRF